MCAWLIKANFYWLIRHSPIQAFHPVRASVRGQSISRRIDDQEVLHALILIDGDWCFFEN